MMAENQLASVIEHIRALAVPAKEIMTVSDWQWTIFIINS